MTEQPEHAFNPVGAADRTPADCFGLLDQAGWAEWLVHIPRREGKWTVVEVSAGMTGTIYGLRLESP